MANCQHALETEFQAELYLDARKIQQVLNNLLSNAIKYSNSGSVITVNILKNSNFIVVSVADQGPGIILSEQNDIFKAFVVSSSKSLSKEKSTGLGLSIAKKIITAVSINSGYFFENAETSPEYLAV